METSAAVKKVTAAIITRVQSEAMLIVRSFGEKFEAQIQQDSQDGMRAGVNGTPGFFINGIFLSGSQPERAFENLVQEQLSASSASQKP